MERAIRMAHDVLGRVGGTVYGLHEIVHNEAVVGALSSKGMVFVDSVAEIPDGATVLVSAHGTSPATYDEAERRRLNVVDATCPFVAAGHAKIRENFRRGLRTLIVGNPEHAEVRGYLGETGACLQEDVRPGEQPGIVVQTTLDAAEHEGVCTATRARQSAVRRFLEKEFSKGLTPSSVGVLIAGSAKSSNTAKLADMAKQAGASVWRVACGDEVAGLDFSGIEVVGVTSGASTPEDVFAGVCAAARAKRQCADGMGKNGK